MDCRVKPGNDSGSVSANARWYYGDPCIIWNGYAGINHATTPTCLPTFPRPRRAEIEPQGALARLRLKWEAGDE
jgi:hypothetical protein